MQEKIKELKEKGARIGGVCFFLSSPKAISCNSDGIFELWGLQRGVLIRKFFEQETGMKSLALDVKVSPCDNYIVSAHSDRTVKIWDEGSGECIKILEGHKNIVRSVDISSDSKVIASGGADKLLKIWNKNTGECLNTFDLNKGIIFSVKFSPDGRYIATASQENNIFLWHRETGELYKRLGGHSASVHSITFSPDGTKLLSGSEDKTLKMWDVERGQCIKTFRGHFSPVESVCFSPYLHYIASGSIGGYIKIWHRGSGKCIRTIKAHSQSVSSIKFSPAGRHLLSGGKDGALKYISLPMKGDEIYSYSYHKEYLIVKPRTVEESFKDIELFERLVLKAEKYLEEKSYELAMKGFRKALDIPGYGKNERALTGKNNAGKGGLRKSIKKHMAFQNF